MSREAPPTTDPTPNGTAPETAAPVQPASGASPERAQQPTSGRPDSLPAAPAPAPAPEQTQAEITDDIRRRVLEGINDDDFKASEAVRNRYNKLVSSEKKKLEAQVQEESRRARESAELHANWNSYFLDLERQGPDAFYRALNDPQTGDRDTQAWAAIKQWRAGTGPGGRNNQQTQSAAVADLMVKNLVDHIRQADEWSHLDDDDISSILGEKDVSTALTRLLMAGTEKERKAQQAKVKAEVEAGINEILAKRGLSANEPEPPRGGVVGIDGGLTLDRYNAMTPQERRQLRKDNPQAIDAMTAALQEQALGATP